ncbi:MAG: hypothetical protein JEZ14_19275 [Marinilabiliaceae bacterium]|nr:hypothetical protein [Marinilabiliaceae bacterium]
MTTSCQMAKGRMTAQQPAAKRQPEHPFLVFILPNFKLSNTHHLIACRLADGSLTVSKALAKRQADKMPPFFSWPTGRPNKKIVSLICQLATY